MIYRHRTLVLACTVYSTPDVHAFFDKRVLLHIPTHLFPWVVADCESISIGRKSNPTTTTTRYKKNKKISHSSVKQNTVSTHSAIDSFNSAEIGHCLLLVCSGEYRPYSFLCLRNRLLLSQAFSYSITLHYHLSLLLATVCLSGALTI